jgi:hypothetical protein
MQREKFKWKPHETSVPMRGTGTELRVVVMKAL